MSDVRKQVSEYYSDATAHGGRMRTSICCCTTDSMPGYIKDTLGQIDPEITDRFYGCGSPLPPALEGCTVLDLGCGTGRDVYIASKLVGPEGRVIGVDMNEDQIAIAAKHRDEMAVKFGYATSNVEFRQGFIEDLSAVGIGDESIDVIISNCVVNLSPLKEQVFREVWRVLKTGGEFYFSDVFSDRRVPKEVASNPMLRGECLGGALYVEDFRRLMRTCGWEDLRYMGTCPAVIGDPEIEDLVEPIGFSSRTVRAVKLPGLIEDICEQYGQIAVYKGTIPHHEKHFDLDDHHRFLTGMPMSVCGNSCAMVQDTRFGKHFTVYGDRSVHYGPFDGCGTSRAQDEGGCSGGGCC